MFSLSFNEIKTHKHTDYYTETKEKTFRLLTTTAGNLIGNLKERQKEEKVEESRNTSFTKTGNKICTI